MDMHHSIIQQSINPLIQSPTPSILASFPGRRLDQFPELRILLQRFVLLHLESRAEEKIFERVPAENAMHHQAQLVALKINPVISHAKPVQNSARPLEFSELIQLGLHDLLGQSAEFAQDLQLQFLRHPRQFGRAGRVKNNLERGQMVES